MLNTLDNYPKLQKFILSGVMAASLVGMVNTTAMAATSTQRIENPPVASQVVKASDYQNKFYEAELKGTPLTNHISQNTAEARDAVNLSRKDISSKFEDQFYQKFGDKPKMFFASNLAFHGEAYANRSMFKDYMGDGARKTEMINEAVDLVKGSDIAFKFSELNFKTYKEAANFESKVLEVQGTLPKDEQIALGNMHNSVYSTRAKDNRETAAPDAQVREWVYKVNEASVKNGGENFIASHLKTEAKELFQNNISSKDIANKFEQFQDNMKMEHSKELKGGFRVTSPKV